jgi:F-type H+-transporting ATPase subunit b
MEVDSMGHTGMRWSAARAVLICLGIFFILPVSSALAASEGGGVTVVPDWSVGIQIVNFLFLIFALNLLLFRPIRKILSERNQKTKGMELAISNAASSAAEKDQAFAKALKDARAQGLKEKESMVNQAQEEERKLIEAINAKAQAQLEDIRRKIAADAEGVRQSLQQDVGTFANEIARKILGRSV